MSIDHTIIAALTAPRGSTVILAHKLGIVPQAISRWKRHGIAARWRPTIWALLETRCPDVAEKLDRDEFLGVLLSNTKDAA